MQHYFGYPSGSRAYIYKLKVLTISRSFLPAFPNLFYCRSEQTLSVQFKNSFKSAFFRFLLRQCEVLSCIEIICSEKCTDINDDNPNAAIFVASASLRSNVATEWSRSFKIIVVAAKWFVSNVAAATI